MILLAVSLAAVILHHFLEAVFAALRKFSIVSTMHFCQSMLFAAISLGLLWWWRFAAESIVIGYGMACLRFGRRHACSGRAGHWPRKPRPTTASPIASSGRRLMRFAIWVWITNLLCHLFGVIDRYMLVHWSGLGRCGGTRAGGPVPRQPHRAAVVPVGGRPAGRHRHAVPEPRLGSRRSERVSDRLNLVLKLTSLVMLAGGVVVLWAAPLLFHVAFEGRYDEGLAVLPWTLTYCVWYSLLLVAQNYIWCAEKDEAGAPSRWRPAWRSTLRFNIVLIPAWGLLGAVISTTVATGLGHGRAVLDQRTGRHAASTGHDLADDRARRTVRRAVVRHGACSCLSSRRCRFRKR